MPSSPPSTDKAELQGLGVLVTRPAHQSGPLCERIADAGGRAVCFPALEILGPRDPVAVRAPLSHLDRFQLAIFISPNAVRHGLELIGESGGLPSALEIAAVGEATARALTAAGHPPAVVPRERFDSEALLALPRLQQVRDESILILRGEGGRALLGDQLRRRGARVIYAEVYRRRCPGVPVDDLVHRWDTIDIVTITSNEILDNLLRLFGATHRALLLATPLLVISERIQQHAQTLGFEQVWLAERVSDTAILAALHQYQRTTS